MWGSFFETRPAIARQANFDHSCCGRDHAHRRIDLYPVEGNRLRTTIVIHVSRSMKGTGGDQTITGLRRAINLPGRQPALPDNAKKLNPLLSLSIRLTVYGFNYLIGMS